MFSYFLLGFDSLTSNINYTLNKKKKNNISYTLNNMQYQLHS